MKNLIIKKLKNSYLFTSILSIVLLDMTNIGRKQISKSYITKLVIHIQIIMGSIYYNHIQLN